MVDMKNLIRAEGDKSVEIQLGVLIFQEGESYLAYCPALELSTYGDSISDAKDAFEDLIKSYSEDCEKMGTLNKELSAHGWIKQTDDIIIPPKEYDINIPTGMLCKAYNESFHIPVHSC
jgi:hypothetical protein